MTEVLSVKVDKKKLRELEAIARDENSDRSATARRLLDVGMKEWRMNKAIETFRRGKVSLWRGATMADVSLREFLEILSERKVDTIGVSPEELEAEVRAIKKETH